MVDHRPHLRNHFDQGTPRRLPRQTVKVIRTSPTRKPTIRKVSDDVDVVIVIGSTVGDGDRPFLEAIRQCASN
jgi:CTP synthase (UTP-ammonia lyase)